MDQSPRTVAPGAIGTLIRGPGNLHLGGTVTPCGEAITEQGDRSNVHSECADEEAMSDVDAIRTLARERDLEFVDLDAHTFDNSSAEVLPEAIALRLHVVAIKCKSGIPVIAVANPDDIFVLDTIRASVGRDFTLVVAPLSRSSGTSTDSTMRPIRPGRQRRRVPSYR